MQDEEVLGKAYDGRLMKRLIGYLRPYKWQVVVALVAIILKAAADVMGPFLTKVAIDKYLTSSIASPHGFLDSWLSADARTGIGQLALLYVGALLISFVLEFLQNYLMQWTGQKVMFDLRKQIFRHLQHMHIGFFNKNPVGRLVTRVTSDVDALNEMFTAGVVAIFEDIFVLAGIMIIMLRMKWWLALITFAVLPLIFWATMEFRRVLRDSYRRIRQLIPLRPNPRAGRQARAESSPTTYGWPTASWSRKKLPVPTFPPLPTAISLPITGSCAMCHSPLSRGKRWPSWDTRARARP